jgi:hypothetical protein
MTGRARARVLVVGLQRGDHVRPALDAAFDADSSSTRRLAELFGDWPRPGVNAVNLLPWWFVGGPRDARQLATGLLEIRHENWIVLCGTKVRAAFGVDDWLIWHQRAGYCIGAIPHPSGRSRYWNDPDNVVAARRFLAGAFGRVEGPTS